MSIDEKSYEQGCRQAFSSILQRCCSELGYDDAGAEKAAWIVERERAVAALRDICSDYGDNDWEPNLSLADIIEKHLHRHLDSAT